MHHSLLENKNRPWQQFLAFSIPSIIGMLLTSGIVIVDGLFIGNYIGQDGLAAVNLTLPVLYFFLGLAIMIGVGGAVHAGHALGAGMRAQACRRFSLSIVLTLIVTSLAAAVCLGCLDGIIAIMNPGDTLYDAVNQYLGTLLWFYPAMMLNIVFSIFLRSQGRPCLSLLFGLTGNLLNILLDWLMIARWQMGPQGAALASGLSVILPMGCGLLYFFSPGAILCFTRFKWKWPLIGNIFFNGSSEMIGQLSTGITAFVFNTVILSHLGIEGVAAYTIAGYTAFAQIMILTGFATGLGPIVGYHFGAKNHAHIRRILNISLVCGIASGVVCWAIVLAFSTRIAAAFSPGNEALLSLAGTGFAIYASAFVVNGFNILLAAFFTAIGNARVSAIIASLRGLLLINILVIFLPKIAGSTGIWASYPLSELLTAAVTFHFMKKTFPLETKSPAAPDRAAAVRS